MSSECVYWRNYHCHRYPPIRSLVSQFPRVDPECWCGEERRKSDVSRRQPQPTTQPEKKPAEPLDSKSSMTRRLMCGEVVPMSEVAEAFGGPPIQTTEEIRRRKDTEEIIRCEVDGTETPEERRRILDACMDSVSENHFGGRLRVNPLPTTLDLSDAPFLSHRFSPSPKILTQSEVDALLRRAGVEAWDPTDEESSSRRKWLEVELDNSVRNLLQEFKNFSQSEQPNLSEEDNKTKDESSEV